MLPPRRAARRHRRQCAGRQADPRFLPEDFRTEPGPAARRRRGENRVRRTGERGRRQVAGGDRRRLHQDRRREHGQRHQENLGAARLRRHPLCAQLLWRRRRPACLPRCRRARHDRGADPSVLVAALGLWNGARRHPRHPAARHRGKSRREIARRHQARRRTPRQGRQSRSRRPGRARGADQDHRAGAHPLRRHRHAADRRGRHACQDEGRVREGAQGAVRLHRPLKATCRRGRVSRGGRRRRQIPRAQAQDHAGQAPLARPHHAVLLQRPMARRRGLHPRAAFARAKGQRPRHHHRAAPDHRAGARLAGRDHREEPSCP